LLVTKHVDSYLRRNSISSNGSISNKSGKGKTVMIRKRKNKDSNSMLDHVMVIPDGSNVLNGEDYNKYDDIEKKSITSKASRRSEGGQKIDKYTLFNYTDNAAKSYDELLKKDLICNEVIISVLHRRILKSKYYILNQSEI
jgi:ABC-type uncharacterized transport system ATPase subunit